MFWICNESCEYVKICMLFVMSLSLILDEMYYAELQMIVIVWVCMISHYECKKKLSIYGLIYKNQNTDLEICDLLRLVLANYAKLMTVTASNNAKSSIK